MYDESYRLRHDEVILPCERIMLLLMHIGNPVANFACLELVLSVHCHKLSDRYGNHFALLSGLNWLKC